MTGKVNESPDTSQPLGLGLGEGLGAWSPIATAPRNGLLVLLCTDGGIVFVGKLNKHLQMWVDDEGRERFRTVSYWMPLPAPPKAPNGPGELPASGGSARPGG